MGGKGAASPPGVFWKTELSSRESSSGAGRAACPLGSGFFGTGWLLREVTAPRVSPELRAVIPVLAQGSVSWEIQERMVGSAEPLSVLPWSHHNSPFGWRDEAVDCHCPCPPSSQSKAKPLEFLLRYPPPPRAGKENHPQIGVGVSMRELLELNAAV